MFYLIAMIVASLAVIALVIVNPININDLHHHADGLGVNDFDS